MKLSAANNIVQPQDKTLCVSWQSYTILVFVFRFGLFSLNNEPPQLSCS